MLEVIKGIIGDLQKRLGQAWTLAAPRLKPYIAVSMVAAAGVLGWQEFVEPDGMFSAAAVMTGQALFKATAGVVMVWGTLKFLDNHIENASFADTLKTASPPEKMLYFACRFIGVCILVGMVIS
jgi:hypothetical protein